MKLSTIVEELIRQSPFIHEAMMAELVNTTSLARHIQEKASKRMGKEVSIPAIVMAIKRMSTGSLPVAERSVRHDQ